MTTCSRAGAVRRVQLTTTQLQQESWRQSWTWLVASASHSLTFFWGGGFGKPKFGQKDGDGRVRGLEVTFQSDLSSEELCRMEAGCSGICAEKSDLKKWRNIWKRRCYTQVTWIQKQTQLNGLQKTRVLMWGETGLWGERAGLLTLPLQPVVVQPIVWSIISNRSLGRSPPTSGSRTVSLRIQRYVHSTAHSFHPLSAAKVPISTA